MLPGAIFVRKNDHRIKTVEDLKDKVILVMKGDNAEEYAIREKISSRIITTETYLDAMQLLSSGQYDAVIAQKLMGLQLLLKNMDINNIVALKADIDKFRQDFCFAVKEGDSNLLSILNEGL